MTLATSAEQLAVCDAIAAWAAQVGTADIARAQIDKPGSDDWSELFHQLAEFGVFAAALPETHGGLGASFADVAAMLERCGHDLVPGPIGETVATALALGLSDDPRAEGLLAAVSAGAAPGVVPVIGAPIAEIGDHLDLMVAGYVDDAVLLVPTTAGWRIVAPRTGTREVSVEVPVDGATPVARVAIDGLGADDVIACGDAELITGVLALVRNAFQSGVSRWALDTAVDYAKVRTQFGVPIGSFQAIKHICADMLCRAEQVEAAAWDLARAVDAAAAAPDGDDHESTRAQLALSGFAADVLVADLPAAITKDCIQVLGGIGFTFEHDAHLYLRSALAVRARLGHGHSARTELARRGLQGDRRDFDIDLSAVEDRRPEVRAMAEKIVATTEAGQRRVLAESGYLAPHWPPPYGLGADPALQLLIDSEFERAGVVRPDLVIGAWAIPTILEHGTEAQRKRFVAPTLAGDIVWCQLFSEPEAGSDLASLRTRATRVDGGWTLTGQKIWTSQAHHAQWGICLARTGGDDVPKHKGITYFLVDMSAPGIDIRPLRELTGRANFNEVFVDDVFVPDDCVVGDVGGGWRLARTTLANERVAMGGSGLGKEMDALLRQIDAMPREPSAAEAAELGRLVADAHIGRVLDARAVTRRLAGHDPGALSNVRKLIGVAHRQSVPEFASDLLGVGGIAASDASDLALQNRCLSIAGGTTQILRTAAAERILGLPRS
ncbi:acyl-CoA dehydrogenase family protein [Gordonia sp. DT219]|uniref:acyl-CoA dehydrogenase family protein n=1 Tax=Gordonia sp. DT219 TaxID=3416658 RepID=UPI003CF6A342